MPPADRPPFSTFRRKLQRPGVLAAGLIVATLAVAGALAYEAVQASASHRRSVEVTLDHHAATAAWLYARSARSWLEYGMNDAATRLQNEADRTKVLPGPRFLVLLHPEKYCDCVTAAFGRTFARLVPGADARLEVEGEPLGERARDDLRDALASFAVDSAPLRREETWRMLQPGTPRLNRSTDVALLWLVRDAARHVRAVYAMIVERAQIERPLTEALGETQFFPPSVVKAGQADSLVRIEVRGPNGANVLASGPETRAYTGSDSLGAMLGHLMAYASINPDAAQLLVPGGVPSSRSPVIAAMLVLMLAMAAAAALVRRREQRLSRLREDFVSGVSHELRTPLTQIRMLSELLATDGFKSDDERTRAIGIVHRESMRLTSLVDNVLEFSRLRRATASPAQMRVAVADVLRDTVDDLTPLIEAQHSHIQLVAESGIHVLGERDAIGRIVRNLVENAAKYGRPSQTIQVALADGDGRARITVDDEGPGVPVEERDRVWQPYYRLDRDRNAPAGGSGLGLSVVADLARALGGTVSVGDAPSGGARFTVDLPRAQ